MGEKARNLIDMATVRSRNLIDLSWIFLYIHGQVVTEIDEKSIKFNISNVMNSMAHTF